MNKKENTTLLIGSFGAQNLGDELILTQALRDTPDAVVMTANPQHSQTFTETTFPTVPPFPMGLRSGFSWLMGGLRPLPVTQFPIRQIIFPGGGLFAIHTRAYFLWWLTLRWCRWVLPQATIHLQHQGFDPPPNRLCQWLLRDALTLVSTVTVRDTPSAQVVHSHSSHSPTIVDDRVLTPLPVAQHPPLPLPEVIFLSAVAPITDTLWHSLQATFPGAQWHFIAFTPADALHCPPGAQLHRPTTQSALRTLYAVADLVLGERYHSFILGLNALAPHQVKLYRPPYSHKVAHLRDQFRLQTLTLTIA